MSPLTKTDKKQLRIADDSAMSLNLADQRQAVLKGTWIYKNNHYRLDTKETLRAEAGKRGTGLQSRDLARYVASSSVPHCLAGWSYLGGAIDALAMGDPDIARHLAYYAELRAAMSLLATQGIGVFDNIHIVVNSSGNCTRAVKKDEGTHQFAWMALEHWGSLARARNLLGELIQCDGFSLGEWMQSFGTGPILGLQASQMLVQWGLDLRRMAGDRESRNRSSYSPSEFNPSLKLNALSASRAIRAFWEPLDPRGTGAFDNLDRHLIRISLEGAFKARTGTLALNAPERFRQQVERMLADLSFEGVAKAQLNNFFARSLMPADHSVLVNAAKSDSRNCEAHHIQVCSRALLLLRIATGSCTRQIRQGGYSKNDLKIWWESVGETKGLWPTGAPPDEFSELWDDVQLALESLIDWEMACASGDADDSQWGFRLTNSNALLRLSTCEPIALWAILP